jgi:hypothetical protein
MATGLRLLGAKRRAEGVNQAECGRGRFAIQLARLRQVRSSFLKVLSLEESASLAYGGREDRSIGPKESALIEEIMDRLLDLVAHHKDRALLRAA